MRKVVSILLLFCMLNSIMPVYATQSVVFTNPRFQIGSSAITTIQAGEISFTVNATYNGNSSQKVLLMLVLYKTGTNEMVTYDKCATELWGGEEELSAVISVPNATDYYLNAFVWDGINPMNIVSQLYSLGSENTPPEAPTGVVTNDTTVKSISLEWDMAYDNISPKGYNVYRDNVKIGSTDEENFTDVVPTEGQKYQYQIEAFDDNNSISSKSTPFSASTADYGIIDFTNRIGSRNITLNTEGADGKVNLKVKKDGLDSAEIPMGNYAFICVDSNFIRQTDKEVVVKITYLDNGANGLFLHYNSTDTSLGELGKNFKPVSMDKTNTGLWKTWTVVLTDAEFKRAANNADFRIGSRSAGSELIQTEYIRKIEVFKGVRSAFPAKSVLSYSDDEFFMTRIKSEEVLSENYNPPIVMNGNACRELSSSSKYMSFDVDNNYIKVTDNVVTIAVVYFDNGNDNLKIEYNSNDASIRNPLTKAVYLPRGNTGKWKKSVVMLNDAAFKNGITGGADFRISSNSADPAYISQVEAARGASPGLGDMTMLPTPTSGPLATPTPKPTPTPIPTPDPDNSLPTSNVVSNHIQATYPTPITSVIFDGSMNMNNMIIKPNSDGLDDSTYTQTTYAGVPCVKLVGDRYIYMKTTNSVVSPTSAVILRITYFDKGIDNFKIQYNSSLPYAYTDFYIVKKDTNQWVTKDIYLSNAALNGVMEGGWDIRFGPHESSGDGMIEYVSRVEVFNAPKTGFLNFVEGEQKSLILRASENPDSGVNVITKNSQSCFGITANKYMYIDICDDIGGSLANSSKGWFVGYTSTLYITYLDEGGGTFDVQWINDRGQDMSVTVGVGDTGTWITRQINIFDAPFKNDLNGADFRISAGNAARYIKNIEINKP